MEVIVVGCQSGDEGKGKFTDLFSQDAYAVVRYQGGPNAGHTVVTHDGEFRFVQVPSGVLRGAIGVLGNGCVINPGKLLGELGQLGDRGLMPRLRISHSAHAIMPYHLIQDQAQERWRGDAVATSAVTGFSTGSGQIGSTKQGVGPCREDKMARLGLRLIDLPDKDLLVSRLNRLIPMKLALLQNVYGMAKDDLSELFDIDGMVKEYHDYGRQLEPFLEDVSAFLADARAKGRYVLYEGTQSTALDIEHGTYPYVSTGYSGAGGVTVGTGTPPTVDFKVVGVAKVYMTQSGGGPLPTELEGPDADYLVERGREFGTVTGRRRRVGWLDLCFLRKSIRIDGIESICLTGLDILAGLPEVPVATHYLIDGQRCEEYPPHLRAAAQIQPQYETFEGWPEGTWSEKPSSDLADLPLAAREYVQFIARSLEVRLAAVGIGRRRDQAIVVESPLAWGD